MARKLSKNDVVSVLALLEQKYPDAECELDFDSKYHLLVAVVLSAQTTDKSVNKVTPALFDRFPDAASLATAADADFDRTVAEVADLIHSIGMYRTKAKNVVLLSQRLVKDFDGEVPADFDSLVTLPGVGRKTANVVLSVGFGEQHIAVDTHVFRVSNRIGLVCEKDVLKTELSLMKVIPPDYLSAAHHSLIFHGRYCCSARNPKCHECPITDFCRYFCDNK